jgi:hypothetical protein
MSDNWYDTAQVCLNGHTITSIFISSPEFRKRFCDKCGVATITDCQSCNSPIRGSYHGGGISLSPYTPPSFCPDCGKPYPWTESKLKAAQELTDLLEDLSPEEREILKKSFDDIIRDTPQTTVSATRFKKIVAKAGKVAADGFREILVDVLSEAAKKIIWP